KDEQVVPSTLVNLLIADYTLDLNEFQNVYENETYRKRFYSYSVSSIPNGTIDLIVNSLAIKVDNGITPGNSTATRTYTSSGSLTFEFSNTTMPIGSSGNLKIDILESGLIYSGITWA